MLLALELANVVLILKKNVRSIVSITKYDSLFRIVNCGFYELMSLRMMLSCDPKKKVRQPPTLCLLLQRRWRIICVDWLWTLKPVIFEWRGPKTRPFSGWAGDMPPTSPLGESIYIRGDNCVGFLCLFLKTNVSLYCKYVSVDDFRDISISSVVSKVFEHCILDRSSDNQVGFKKKSNCTHAVFTHTDFSLNWCNRGSPWTYSAYLKTGFSYAPHVSNGIQLFHGFSVLTVVLDRAEYYRRICLHCTSTVSLIELV